jgi:hypothetical protein
MKPQSIHRRLFVLPPADTVRKVPAAASSNIPMMLFLSIVCEPRVTGRA